MAILSPAFRYFGCTNFMGLEIESFLVCPKDKKEMRNKTTNTNLIRLFI
jgi:hypothetical protein